MDHVLAGIKQSQARVSPLPKPRLQAGEFTTLSLQAYDPDVHLSLGDLALDSHTNPTLARVRIKQSKTDPFRHGVDIYLGDTGEHLCPVQALIQFLAFCLLGVGPLFRFQSGAPLTRSALVSHLQSALRHIGIDSSPFTGHSFRIGTATTAAARGLEDSLIQSLGRWKSAAYLAYIKIPCQQLASVSSLLASSGATSSTHQSLSSAPSASLP